MAQRYANKECKLNFAHVPKDGKTPIHDSTSKTWSYVEAPTVEQMTASSNRLKEIDMASATASSTAAAAKVAAQTAQETADTKVTAEGALTAARNGMIEINPIKAHHEPFRSIEFLEKDPGIWKILVHFGDKSLPMSTDTRGELDYATQADFNMLYDEVIKIKAHLGID